MTFKELLQSQKPILIFTEKSSVRKSFANIIAKHFLNQTNTKEENGVTFLAQNIFIFSSEGHIVKLNDDYLQQVKANFNFRINHLDVPQWIVDDNPFKKKRLQTLTALLKKIGENSLIINATDAGREGQLIFYAAMNRAWGSTFEKNKYQHHCYRIWLEATDEQSIIHAFNHLQANKTFQSLDTEAITRQILDYNVGMVASVYATKKHNLLSSLGRVQTPTLSIIVNRHFDVLNQAEKQPSHIPFLMLQIDEKICLKAQLIKQKYPTGYPPKIEPNKDLLKFLQKKTTCSRTLFKVLEQVAIQQKKEYQKLLLFNLTDLQSSLNQVKKMPVKKWMEFIQQAYDEGFITYPRTDSKHLPQAMKNEVQNILQQIVVPNVALTNKGNEYLFDDTKISDHYAIILTSKSAKNTTQKNPTEEVNIIVDTVKKRMLIAFFPPLICRINIQAKVLHIFDTLDVQTEIIIDKNGSNTDNQTAISNIDNITKEHILNAKIQRFGTDISVPKRIENYTEIGLIKQMAKNEMGTPATRDTGAIFESLYKSKYILNDEKSNKILPTEKGIQMIKNLNNTLYTNVDFSVEFEKILKQNNAQKIADFQEKILQDFFHNYIQNPAQYQTTYVKIDNTKINRKM